MGDFTASPFRSYPPRRGARFTGDPGIFGAAMNSLREELKTPRGENPATSPIDPESKMDSGSGLEQAEAEPKKPTPEEKKLLDSLPTGAEKVTGMKYFKLSTAKTLFKWNKMFTINVKSKGYWMYFCDENEPTALMPGKLGWNKRADSMAQVMLTESLDTKLITTIANEKKLTTAR